MNEELLKRLDLLAAKLSTTVDHLWSVVVRQARVEAIQDTICLILSLVAAWYLGKWGRWLVADPGKDGIAWVAIAFLGIAVAYVLVSCLCSIPTELLNPEYFALHRLMEGLR
jgi:hypothetical protein